MDAARRDRRLRRRVGAAESGSPLLELLEAWLPPLTGAAPPRARVRAMIAAGAVRVDGVPLRRPGRPLRAGQLVEALVRTVSLQPKTSVTDRPFTMSEAAVLFRDRWLLAVSKPPGLPTHATADPRRASLVSAVESWLRAEGRPVSVAVHQRLDRDTSGIVLLGIDAGANAGLAEAFAGRAVEKTYLALTDPPATAVPDELMVEAPLAVGRNGRVQVSATGLPARTRVRVRERLPSALLVEAQPQTGRKHQVRVHLAHTGLPVLGDALYGRRGAPVPRLMLHAWRLALAHPVTGGRLVLESPLPPDFREALRALRPARARR